MAELDLEGSEFLISKPHVLKRLAVAFDTACVPKKGEVKKANTTERNLEAEQIDCFFAGKHWREIRLPELRHDYRGDPSACLGFMNREAFWYYMPAFLRICIVDSYDADATYETTLWHLTPSASSMSLSQFTEFVEPLSRGEKMAIACAVAYLAREAAVAGELENLAEQAFVEYWGEYLSTETSSGS